MSSHKEAWTEYFETGNRTPLVEAYWKSIEYIAFERYPKQQEDMFQMGMMGLLRALDRLDPKRVKSLDAWVYLNVRGMMYNASVNKIPLGGKPVRHRRNEMTYRSLDALIDGTEENLEFLHDRRDDNQIIAKDMLKDLPKRDAFIVWMIHVEGYLRTEVAKMFGLSSMRIGQLEKRALQALESVQSEH